MLKQSFYAVYQAMLTFEAMRWLTLQLNQLFPCPLQIWSFLQVNVFLVSPKFCTDEWQDILDCCEANELHFIYPTVGIAEYSKNMSRYDSVLLNNSALVILD